MRIIVLGAPGAGKGTHCKRISERYGLLHLSSGDILRRERADGTDLGKQAQSYMDSGKLVPDDLIVEMMGKAITAAPESGWILDGFPRTVNQAEKLDIVLKEAGYECDLVLNLVVDDSVVCDRLTGRRSCPECGAVYHIQNMPSKDGENCDKDGVKLVQRPDDTVEVVSNRLKTYYEQTAPVVDYYKENYELYDIDGNMSADEATDMIFKKLDSITSV